MATRTSAFLGLVKVMDFAVIVDGQFYSDEFATIGAARRTAQMLFMSQHGNQVLITDEHCREYDVFPESKRFIRCLRIDALKEMLRMIPYPFPDPEAKETFLYTKRDLESTLKKQQSIEDRYRRIYKK